MSVAFVPDITPDIARLTETAREVGALRERQRWHQLGLPMALSNDVPLHELLRVIEAAGLCLSTVDGVQVIHKFPNTAA